MKSLGNFSQHPHKHSFKHQSKYFLLQHTCNSFVFCFLSRDCPPQTEVDVHSVCTEGRVGDTAASGKAWLSVCLPSVQSLHFSAHYPPGERVLNVIMLKPTQPLTLSHASSQISLTRLFHRRSGFPQTPLSLFDAFDFVAWCFCLSDH